MRVSVEGQGLASGWSHDIRTHLNILLGAVGMLEANRLTPEQEKEYVAMIRHNAHAMLRLVNQMLGENARDSDTGEARLGRLQVDGLLLSVVRSIAPYAASRQLELLYDIEAPMFVWCDAMMFERILYNLLSNAVKYTDPGGFVYVSAKTRGVFAEINVSDTGHGLRKEQLEMITGDMDACHEVGLGLSLVRKMVSAMRGHIRVTTRENVGTTFHLQLPIADTALCGHGAHRKKTAEEETPHHVKTPSLAGVTGVAMLS